MQGENYRNIQKVLLCIKLLDVIAGEIQPPKIIRRMGAYHIRRAQSSVHFLQTKNIPDFWGTGWRTQTVLASVVRTTQTSIISKARNKKIKLFTSKTFWQLLKSNAYTQHYITSTRNLGRENKHMSIQSHIPECLQQLYL